ncbi:MAG: CvpA family protein [Alphaproteobacteria bacterium]|nr:MAG: CvpA family protein [Alphaproteobacteria bacterium]
MLPCAPPLPARRRTEITLPAMSELPINITDAAILLVVVVSGVFAFIRGFVHELLAVASWIGAGLATLYGFAHVQPYARELIASPLIADIAAGVALFLVVLVLLSIATRLLARRVRDSSLGPLDRSLGLLFGFARGAVLVSIAWLALSWILPREDYPPWLSEARSLPLVERGGHLLIGLLPAHLRDSFEAPTPRPAGTAAGDFDALLRPPPKAGARGEEPGYKGAERSALQRLIEAATRDGTAPPAATPEDPGR